MTTLVEAPRRVQLSRARGWRLPPDAVKVDRTTPWSNPFRVGVDGTAAECAGLYRKLLWGYLCLTSKATPESQLALRRQLIAHHGSLAGKDLACWCALDKPCHADALLDAVRILNEGARA